MAKEVKSVLKLQIQAGQANPSPPVGPALGQAGVNIMGFCKEFNAATQASAGDLLPTIITVYNDSSFTFVTKQPPAAVLLKKAAKLESAANNPGSEVAGKVTRAQVKEIAEMKVKDLNSNDVEGAMRMVEGTARACGIDVVD